MYTISVCERESKEEVACYTYSTSSDALVGRIEVMQEWIQGKKKRVLVSAIMPKISS